MPKYIITKTTVETLGIETESLGEANSAAQKGQGDTMTIQTTINIRPRPEPQKVGIPSGTPVIPQ